MDSMRIHRDVQIELRAPWSPSQVHGFRLTGTADVERDFEQSVGTLDGDVAMNTGDMVSGASDRYCLVGCFAGTGAAGQPYDAILVGVDMNSLQACNVLRSQLALDLGGDCRVLDVCTDLRTVGRQVLVRNRNSGSKYHGANGAGE